MIRHGESEADTLDVHEGRADFELTQKGHRQAAAMAKYVAGNYRLTRIYASTLKRAAQTAKHLPMTLPVAELKYSASLVCTVATFAAIQEGHFIRTGKENREKWK